MKKARSKKRDPRDTTKRGRERERGKQRDTERHQGERSGKRDEEGGNFWQRATKKG